MTLAGFSVPFRATTLRAGLLLGGMLLAGSALAPAARAQMDSREAIGLQNQILDLRHQMELLQSQGPAPRNGGGSSLGGGSRQPPPSQGSGDLVASLLDRVSTLEDQVRDLRGQIQGLQNAQQQQTADLQKQIGDLTFQLQNGGVAAGGGSGAGSAPPPAAPQPRSPQAGNLGSLPASAVPPPAAAVPAGPAATPRRTPELAMQEGNAALARRDYKAAESAAREVLSGGRSPRAYDAQFLLAQSLAGERNWRDAAVAYGDSYQRNTSSGHAQDSLLGLANSLTALGDKKSACDAMDTLRAQFSTPRADLRESIAASRARAGCR